MYKYYELIDGRVTHCPGDEEGRIAIYSDPTAEEKRFLIFDGGYDDGAKS